MGTPTVLVVSLAVLASCSLPARILAQERCSYYELGTALVVDTTQLEVVAREVPHDDSTDGARAIGFYAGDTLRVLKVYYRGETGRTVVEYYFYSPDSYVALLSQERYSQPYYMEGSRTISVHRQYFYYCHNELLRQEQQKEPWMLNSPAERIRDRLPQLKRWFENY